MKAIGGKTAIPSETPSRSSFFLESQDELATKKRSRSLNDLRKLKKLCLAREENRCAVTRAYDIDMAEKLPEEQRQQLQTARTECAHIIPSSMAPESQDAKVDKQKIVALFCQTSSLSG